MLKANAAMMIGRVLVTEDDAVVRRLLATTLRRRRMEVHLVRDGVEALAALQSERWDVLLLDLMMPRLSGWDVLQWLATYPERKPRSVIVMSAANRDLLRNVDPSVVNAIFFKPFDVVRLAAYVKGVAEHEGVDRRRARVFRLT